MLVVYLATLKIHMSMMNCIEISVLVVKLCDNKLFNKNLKMLFCTNKTMDFNRYFNYKSFINCMPIYY